MMNLQERVEWLLSEAPIATKGTFDYNRKLYHISFRSDQEGVWNPRNPDGSQVKSKKKSGVKKEPNLPRISMAPTVEQCFQAIFPNISQYFEEKNYPHMDFYVYSPVFKGNERVLTPTELTRKGYVHDAHMTDEHCVLDKVQMKLVQKIRVFNTNKNEFLKYKPFGNDSSEERWFAPNHVKYTVLKTYE